MDIIELCDIYKMMLKGFLNFFFFSFGLKFLTISLVVMFAKQYGKIASRVFKTRVFQIILLLPSDLVLRFFRLSSSSCVFQIGSSDRLRIFMCFPDRFFRSSLDRSSSSFRFGFSVLQNVFIFVLFLNRFFRSSSDLHAFSRSIL